MHCFMVACVQTTPTPLQFLLRDGGGPEITESYEYYHE